MKSLTSMRRTFTSAAAVAIALSASASHATDIKFEAGLSTMGLYAAPSFGITDNTRIRTPLYLGRVSRDVTAEGNTLDATINSFSAAVMADYYLGTSGLRVSGGLSLGGYRLNGSVNNPTLDGITYDGSFTADIRQRRNVAPVLALGYSQTIGENFGLMFEVGGRFTSMRLTTTGQESLGAADRATFDDSIADINRDLRDFPVVPFLSLGFTYRF